MGKGSIEEEGKWASLCNCVVNFLLEEGYQLTAFELLHELLEDGRHDHAIRLKNYFSDSEMFPPDQIARFNSSKVADPQALLEEKTSTESKLALTEYDLRLAQEDVTRLTLELQKKKESSPQEANGSLSDVPLSDGPSNEKAKREITLSSLGPLKDAEKRDLNCAVKEYLLFAGYRLTAMTFIEEVTDQNLDIWPNNSAFVSDALRRYYYQYLSSTSEAAEEKISLLRENETLVKEKESLSHENDSLLKSKELAEGQVSILKRSLETTQKDLKDKDKQVQDLKQAMEIQRKELNDCRMEITALKMHIESSRSGKAWPDPNESEDSNLKLVDLDPYSNSDSNSIATEEPLSSLTNKTVTEYSTNGIQSEGSETSDSVSVTCNGDVCGGKKEDAQEVLFVSIPEETETLSENVHSSNKEKDSHNMAMETIQVLADALPKIVPYVLINHREELLPLIMCAIERHPDGNVRDSLTHTLFNLIKRPDEQQRRVIMDACVNLAKNIGEMRTETELLPQCWEQINHKNDERRLLVAQSCGELAGYVRPEIRDSLILSIVQQLVEDTATVVREAAAHNLALLLPLFPNFDKYFKVEELMFQLVCDPSGLVVDTVLKELVPAVINWGGKLDHVLRVCLSHILGSAQRCPPISGVEGSVDSYLRALGERERWNIDVLLRLLTELLPFIYQKAVDTCPFTPSADPPTSPKKDDSCFSTSFLKLYATGHMEWPLFEWMHTDCLHDLIKLATFLPQKEDNLRTRIVKYLLNVSERYGKDYMEHIMLPVFLVAVGDGDSADFTFLPLAIQSRVKGLQPKNMISERLATMCVLPLLLSGILGSPLTRDQLAAYLRKILVQSKTRDNPFSSYHTTEFIDAVRFLCTFEEHHGTIFSILWEMVVSSDPDLKANAAALLKALAPYIDAKVASTHVLPALVTLGSDQNLNVKYASIDAFGAVAQHFKNEMIVDKIKIQMDAFLEDGSHEATTSVIRALVVAVPHTTDKLREYLLSKIFKLTSIASQGSDIRRRREQANAFCEAIRALDATDIPATNTRDFLLPSIQNLLKDPDALDPAHKEALEIILRERSGLTFESISSKVMGAHIGLASSVSSFFGDSGLLGKKEAAPGVTMEQLPHEVVPVGTPQSSPLANASPDDTAFRRIMRGGFGDMLRGKAKGVDDSPKQNQ
ncbi:LisH domain and HEAT repeat-containing protein KIAA1468 [Rhynchospora pubera]|uniref:LisH domain and HEAT repeat-containing protein KIAA1468 n=1 Tax=Rhynchospora pubera TaxID=906938 RepID=A0AAV8GUN5_9POAL|nr:LisH domain and HEAT repeat-containing protein KIAA1468 [Rhynchospora pubera]